MGLSGSGRPASLTFEGPRRTTARVMSRAAAPMRLNWWIRVERRKRSNEMAEITENRPTMPIITGIAPSGHCLHAASALSNRAACTRGVGGVAPALANVERGGGDPPVLRLDHERTDCSVGRLAHRAIRYGIALRALAIAVKHEQLVTHALGC
eukprot:scaffold75374_cov69-Phaeocystis_antarctica.AAC.8